MILEAATLGYGGLFALWLRQEAVAQAPAGFVPHCGAVLLASALAIITLHCGGAYHLTDTHMRDCIGRAILVWLSLATGLIVTAAVLALDRHFDVGWAGLWLVLATVCLAVERCLVAFWLPWLKKKPLVRHRVVIVPALKGGLLLERKLKASSELGLEVLGFVDDRPIASLPTSFPRECVIGDTQRLVRMIREGEVDEVVITLPWTAAARIGRILLLLSETPVRVSLATGPVAEGAPIQRPAALGGVPVVRLSDRPIGGLCRFVKKLEDVVLASLMLVMLMPLIVPVALAIKLDSPGPVLFRQPRVGFNGHCFTVLKFRTMHAVATDVAGKQQARKNDPRITRVGGWLRRTSIDELPQLVNVLRGEMSLVGPRPHAQGTTVEGRRFDEAVNRYAARHRVKPGITGWAQVNGWRGETDVTVKLEERLRYDLYYIDNWSLWLDCLVLARTLLVPFRRRNAY